MNTHHMSFKKDGFQNEEQEQKRGGEKNLSSLLTSYFEKTRVTDTSSTNHAALLAWYCVAGIAEKEHTTGVFVVPAKYNQSPKLIVYVDSNSLRIDCMARREVYLQRFATVGHEFSCLEFKLSKYKKKQITADVRLVAEPEKKYYTAPESKLTQDQRETIESIVKMLPESYREEGYKAVLASFLRRKCE